MRKEFLLLLLLPIVLLSSCGRKGSYSDGFNDGYDIGYVQGQQAAATEASDETTTPAIGAPAQLEPQNGFLFEEIPQLEAAATLSIRTSGSGGYYFVIDPVEFPAAGEEEFYKIRAQLLANNFSIRLYVRGGSTAQIAIPLGEYAIYYARGTEWYGEEYLFGPETAYYQFDDTFVFKKSSKGYTKWSISSSDAELISESEFPTK